MPHGISWNVRSRGAADGAPILLLHGFTWDGSLWDPVADALGPAFRVHAVDLPGHGSTTGWPADPTFGAVAAAIVSLAARLQREDPGRRPLILAGYSLGARLALQAALLATRHPPVAMPLGSLVLVSGTAGIALPDERARRSQSDAMLAADLRKDGIERFVDRWERLPVFDSPVKLPQPLRAALRAVRLAQSPEGLARSLELMGQGRMPPMWDDLGRLQVPTLLVAGAEDRKYRKLAEQLGAAIPRATLRIMPGCGHSVPLEAPDSLAKALADFAAAGSAAAGSVTSCSAASGSAASGSAASCSATSGSAASGSIALGPGLPADR